MLVIVVLPDLRLWHFACSPRWRIVVPDSFSRSLRVRPALSTGSSTNHRDALSCYLSDLNRHSRVTPAEEIRLARRIGKGDRKALNRLVEANLNFVILISRQYTGMGL